LLAFAKYQGIHLPVLSLAYAAAVLRRSGHEVSVLDLARVSGDDAAVLERAAALRPDWVVSVTSLAFLGAELDWLGRLRQACGCARLLLGATAGHYAAEILQRGLAEAIAMGDPEVAIGHLAHGTLRPGVAGVAMAGADAAQPAWLPDLAALPWPDWSGFDLSAYSYHPLLKRQPLVTMQASRGCPYACDFCPYPVGQGLPFRPRPVADVVAEMAALVQRHGVRSILFRDATFTLDMRRGRALADAIAAAGLGVQWAIETRLDRLDEELLGALAAAGCKTITFGIDPLEPDTCRASHRKAYLPDRAKRLIAEMDRLGIAATGLFVVGLPEQDEDELLRTMAWVEDLPLRYVNYEQATVFPGTPMYERAVSRGWAARATLDEVIAGEPKLVYNGKLSQAQIRALQDRGLRRFYGSPRRVWREFSDREVSANVRFYTRTLWRFARDGESVDAAASVTVRLRAAAQPACAWPHGPNACPRSSRLLPIMSPRTTRPRPPPRSPARARCAACWCPRPSRGAAPAPPPRRWRARRSKPPLHSPSTPPVHAGASGPPRPIHPRAPPPVLRWPAVARRLGRRRCAPRPPPPPAVHPRSPTASREPAQQTVESAPPRPPSSPPRGARQGLRVRRPATRRHHRGRPCPSPSSRPQRASVHCLTT
jgi:radical SAM superfamily enzyme YgiQ (UPF0313 family)